MLAMIAYLFAAVSALATAAFGLAILLGGSAQLGKEAAVAADKALIAPASQAARGNDVGASAKTTGGSAAAEEKPAPVAKPTAKSAKAAAKRKKRNAATRNAHRN